MQDVGCGIAAGLTFDLAAALPLRWKTKTTHKCEKAARPSSACDAFIPVGRRSLRVATEDGHTQPCRGVPFFSTKQVCNRPIGRARKRSSVQMAFGA